MSLPDDVKEGAGRSTKMVSERRSGCLLRVECASSQKEDSRSKYPNLTQGPAMLDAQYQLQYPD